MCFSLEIDKSLHNLSKRFKAKIDEEAYDKFQDLKKLFPKNFKEPKTDNRIYPNYFAPVIIINEIGERVIIPMRYRVRPAKSPKEIPSKYNLFNARIDSLETRQTWKKLFMKNHGLFAFNSFFEWVEDEKGKKVLINFRPENKQIMWAPCLWDHWQDLETKKEFSSFAIITDNPPPEVSEMGHDRCPIFIKEKFIDEWLKPINLTKKKAINILKHKEDAYFINSFVA